MGKQGGLLSKRLAVYKQNFDAQGRDLGEDLHVLVLDKTLILLKNKGLVNKHIKDFKIQSLTVFRTDANVDKSVIGRAIVGGILTGGIGAIVGGLSGTTKSKTWFCEIAEPNGQLTLFRLRNEADANVLKKWYSKKQ